MTRWAARSSKFKVKIVYSAKRQAQITVPWPLIKSFHKPDTVTFIFAEQDIIVKFGKDDKGDKIISDKSLTEIGKPVKVNDIANDVLSHTTKDIQKPILDKNGIAEPVPFYGPLPTSDD